MLSPFDVMLSIADDGLFGARRDSIINPLRGFSMAGKTKSKKIDTQKVIGTQPAHAVFHHGELKSRSFRNLVFFLVP